MDFYEIESETGVRMVWNNLPPNKLAATRSVLPMGVHYTPYKDIEGLKTVDYDPVICRCGGILNPYCFIDFRNKFWVCPFCNNKNPFPQLYKEYISETQLPLELQMDNTTLEYQGKLSPQAPNQGLVPNVFLFLIDTCLSEEDMEALKTSIQESLKFIPQDAYIGLVTYGRYVFVHELGFQDCPKSYAIKGNKEYTPQQIQEMLGLQIKHDPRGTGSFETTKRFLLKLEDCQFTLDTIIDNLQPDPWVVENGKRQQRATGTALNVAITLMESCPYQGSRILSFLGGPCTVGPGLVVEEDLAFTIRGYLDIQKENQYCKYINKAKKYYNSLTQRAVKVMTVVDTYAFSVDQIGLMEMKFLSEKTGGYAVLNEEFNADVFKQTYKKLFDLDPETNELKFATASKIDMLVSKELKINGALGCCTSLKKGGTMVSETEIGQGGTNTWFLGGIDRTTTVTFMLDLNSNAKELQQNNQQQNQQKQAYFQFKTEYKAPNGRKKLRVTTIARKFADVSNNHDLQLGFDQEAACVAMARWGIWKCEQEESLEVLKWLDRTLIRLVSKFGDYKRDDPSSFRLCKEFSLYPQFMYHLRRSHFIQTFGSSPDEITFYRVTLNRENVTNCLVMIQPALLQYTLEDPQANPVTLDQSAIQNRVILLLDTYFQVITWKGDHIQQWIDQGYHEQPEYAHLKALIEAPLEDVNIIMEDRFPVPIFFETNTGHTKERYLKSRINPSGHVGDINETGHYITDDASLKLFMDHLIKLGVQSQN
ncbi:Zinc finger, Sec23/Sec24-type [Pseudocohnilembus persalinus]|uniref:Protein transport protein SEC23 n=1 Tax=Pseudocohnilembus persalinus TaxID=266149 RepID=A0A0V0QC93_PSEPJ|nr:Zinc finger, Sec23/Sec24-type [Pseudocohnilembus persalinus]|eukprot:KRW99808.1 Zinc finger, Sec23/Sec24-type [Pseudocohnilembus persalinus]